MSDNNKQNNIPESMKRFSYQPTMRGSYQPTNNGTDNKSPEPPKAKSAEK